MRAEGAEKRVWWYIDGKYVGTSLPNETFFSAMPDGEHVVGAMDSEGRSASVKVSSVTPGKKKKYNGQENQYKLNDETIN